MHPIGGVRSAADSQAYFGWMLLAHVSLARALVAKQIVFDSALVLLLGVLVAFLSRTKA